jgi:hypothetical protein
MRIAQAADQRLTEDQSVSPLLNKFVDVAVGEAFPDGGGERGRWRRPVIT